MFSQGFSKIKPAGLDLIDNPDRWKAAWFKGVLRYGAQKIKV
jgi:hypothetical protein